MTKVVNIYKDEYDVYIGRKGKNQDGYFGNPFPLKQGEERGSTLSKYEEYFYNRLENDLEFKEKILSLKGKRLGCFCKPHSCHGDIIKEYLDNMSSILDTKIDYYPGKIWKTQKLGEITLRQFIEVHKNPKDNIKEVFNKIAEAEKNEDWETKGKLKQENLYYFTPCVKLDGKGRGYENILKEDGFTGALVLDFDHIKGDAEKFRDKLFDSLQSVICAYVSPSKKGVKALIHIQKVSSVDEFKEYFYGIAYELEHMDSFDGSGQNCCLPNFLSWDENIRWRENPEIWTQRGGKHDEFEEYAGDYEEIEDVTDEDKKEVLQRAYNIIKKADEENTGHPNCVNASLILSGFVPSGYITYDEAESYLFKWVDDSPYLSTKANTYKKTIKTMMQKGMRAPLYLKKHQDKKPLELQEKEKNTKKRERKYYKLCNFSTFNLERGKEIVIFGEI